MAKEIMPQNQSPNGKNVIEQIKQYVKEREEAFYEVDKKVIPSASTIISQMVSNNISVELVRFEETKDERGTKVVAVVVAKRKMDNGDILQVPEVVSFYIEDKIQAQFLRAIKKRAYELYKKGVVSNADEYIYKTLRAVFTGDDKVEMDVESYLLLKDLELRTRIFASRIAITQAQARAVAKLLSKEDWLSREEREMEKEEVDFVNDEYSPPPTATKPDAEKKYLDKEFPIFKSSLKNLQRLYNISDEEYHQFLKSHGYEHSTNVPPEKRDIILVEFKKFCENKKKEKEVSDV